MEGFGYDPNQAQSAVILDISTPEAGGAGAIVLALPEEALQNVVFIAESAERASWLTDNRPAAKVVILEGNDINGAVEAAVTALPEERRSNISMYTTRDRSEITIPDVTVEAFSIGFLKEMLMSIGVTAYNIQEFKERVDALEAVLRLQ